MGFRKVRMIIIAVCVVVPAVLWIVRGLAPASASYAVTVVSVVVAILAILVPRLSLLQPADVAEWLDQAVDELTIALEEQWREEEAIRGVDLLPLPVYFRTVADPGLMSSWDAIVGIPGAGPILLKGTFDRLAEVFAEPGSPQRLVVLGELGSGKTALVLRLTLDLLRRRGGTEPVPVLLPIGSWDPAEDLEDWVAARLCDQFPALSAKAPEIGGSTRTVARALLARRRVLPILDGLDEVEQANRGLALQQLSKAVRRGLHVVVTCRTQEYRELLDEPGQQPLQRTPVVELEPVELTDVHTYLTRHNGIGKQWDPVFDHLKFNPRGVLADVLSTPLMVWLARMVYQYSQTNPTELIALATHPDRVRQHLLDGLIPAVYAERTTGSRYPARTGKALEPTYRALTTLATYLQARSTQNLAQDIAWWQLHEQVPVARIAISVGVVTGCVLGAAAGLATSVKYGPATGLLVGFIDVAIAGVLCAATVTIPKKMPRVLNFRVTLSELRRRLLGGLVAGLAVGLSFGYACEQGGGLRAGIVVFLVVTPVGAVAVGSVFGPISGLTGGTSAGLTFGLAAVLAADTVAGMIAGLTTGTVFTIMGWIWTGLYQPTTITHAISSDRLFRGDRTSSLVVGVTSGVAYGIAYVFAAGPWIGALATLVLMFAVTITVSTWGQFLIARAWLAIDRKAPFDIMGVLREAHERGVLRQNGMYYQFRHNLLQKRLASKHPLTTVALDQLKVVP